MFYYLFYPCIFIFLEMFIIKWDTNINLMKRVISFVFFMCDFENKIFGSWNIVLFNLFRIQYEVLFS